MYVSTLHIPITGVTDTQVFLGPCTLLTLGMFGDTTQCLIQLHDGTSAAGPLIFTWLGPADGVYETLGPHQLGYHFHVGCFANFTNGDVATVNRFGFA